MLFWILQPGIKAPLEGGDDTIKERFNAIHYNFYNALADDIAKNKRPYLINKFRRVYLGYHNKRRLTYIKQTFLGRPPYLYRENPLLSTSFLNIFFLIEKVDLSY